MAHCLKLREGKVCLFKTYGSTDGHMLLIYALARVSEGYHAFYKNMHFRHKLPIFIVFVAATA